MKAIKNSKGAYQKKNIRYIPPPLIAVKYIRRICLQSRFVQVTDDYSHLPRHKCPHPCMVSRKQQFRIQFAVTFNPARQRTDSTPCRCVGAIQACQLSFRIRSDTEAIFISIVFCRFIIKVFLLEIPKIQHSKGEVKQSEKRYEPFLKKFISLSFTFAYRSRRTERMLSQRIFFFPVSAGSRSRTASRNSFRFSQLALVTLARVSISLKYCPGVKIIFRR